MALGYFGVPTLWTQNQSQTPCDLNCLTEPALVDVARPCEQSHWRAAFQRAVCLLFLKIFFERNLGKIGVPKPYGFGYIWCTWFFSIIRANATRQNGTYHKTVQCATHLSSGCKHRHVMLTRWFLALSDVLVCPYVPHANSAGTLPGVCRRHFRMAGPWVPCKSGGQKPGA